MTYCFFFSCRWFERWCLFIHRGFIPFLPRSVGLAYYSADATACLISLGFIQSWRGSYSSIGHDHVIVKDPTGNKIDLASLGLNKLPAVSADLMRTWAPLNISSVSPRPPDHVALSCMSDVAGSFY